MLLRILTFVSPIFITKKLLFSDTISPLYKVPFFTFKEDADIGKLNRRKESTAEIIEQPVYLQFITISFKYEPC